MHCGRRRRCFGELHHRSCRHLLRAGRSDKLPQPNSAVLTSTLWTPQALLQTELHYPPVAGTPGLRAAVADWHGATPDDVLVTVGVAEVPSISSLSTSSYLLHVLCFAFGPHCNRLARPGAQRCACHRRCLRRTAVRGLLTVTACGSSSPRPAMAQHVQWRLLNVNECRCAFGSPANSQANSLIVATLVQPGDHVVVMEPGYRQVCMVSCPQYAVNSGNCLACPCICMHLFCALIEPDDFLLAARTGRSCLHFCSARGVRVRHQRRHESGVLPVGRRLQVAPQLLCYKRISSHDRCVAALPTTMRGWAKTRGRCPWLAPRPGGPWSESYLCSVF